MLEGLAFLEDYRLIKRIMKGDGTAFDTLVRKHYSNIFAYCYRRTHNENLAADLTQDVFLRVVETIYKYQFTGKFTNFIFTIAVNKCNDYYRKKDYNVDYDLSEISDTSDEPSDLIIKQEEQAQLREWLDELPDFQREALTLYYYHDLKAKDVAKITGVSIATAKSRIKQGLDKIRKRSGG